MPITWVHGETWYVLARMVTIATDPVCWRMEVGVVQDLPVPLQLGLLGRDWSGIQPPSDNHNAVC